MKTMNKLITAGLILSFFVIVLVGLSGLNKSTIEASEGKAVSKTDSQAETSISNEQETIYIEFRIKPEFEQPIN